MNGGYRLVCIHFDLVELYLFKALRSCPTSVLLHFSTILSPTYLVEVESSHIAHLLSQVQLRAQTQPGSFSVFSYLYPQRRLTQ